jgi:4-hydroxybenzoate polyprenyltransferase
VSDDSQIELQLSRSDSTPAGRPTPHAPVAGTPASRLAMARHLLGPTPVVARSLPARRRQPGESVAAAAETAPTVAASPVAETPPLAAAPMLRTAVPAPVPAPAPALALAPAPAPAPIATPTRRPPRLLRRARDFARLMRLDRPIGIWLLLWPELWALWIASSGHPSRQLLAIFFAGTVVMRSAGCVINDLFDRNIDPHVRRTQSRPLASRVLGPYEALVVFVILLGTAGVLALQLDQFTLELAFVGAGLTITYPLMKRFFPFPQLYLGLAFGWAVPLAFAATQGHVPRVGWLLLLAAVLWAGIYDTMYAMADREDDLRIGVQSSAILFADMDRLMIGAMQVMMLLALWLVGRSAHFGGAYLTALCASAGFFLWQQWLIRDRDRGACLTAFQNNQYVGVAIFAGVLLEYVGAP